MTNAEIVSYLSILIPLGTSLAGAVITFFVYKDRVDSMSKSVDKLSEEMRQIRDKVISCETSLKERAQEQFWQRQSPVSLTPSGEKLLKDSGGHDFVAFNLQELSSKVDDAKPKTAYDVQEQSQKVLQVLRDDDRFNTIKDYAFKEGMALEVIIQVMALYLRDRILAAKGLDVKDIDKDDPNC